MASGRLLQPLNDLRTGQRFIGMAGIDISTGYLQAQVEKVSQALYDGVGVIQLFSPRGIMTADSNSPEQVGQNISRIDPVLAESVSRAAQTGQETRHVENGQMMVLKPFRLGSSEQHWVTIISVPESIIYQSVTQQQQMLGERQWQFITYISIVGPLLALAGVLVVRAVAKSSIRPLHDMTGIVGSLADGEGDLTQRVTLGRKDETRALAGFLNQFITKLQNLIQGMMPIGQLTTLSTQGRSISDKTNQQMQHQRDLVDQMVSAVIEMAASAQQIAGNAERTAVLVNDANHAADAGGNLVRQNVDSINEVKNSVESSEQALTDLLDSSAAITQILSEIQGIAEQTNLLALNAAIEAARAGDKGRGFAVVADEVRALAGRTQEATTEIQNRLKQLNQCNRQASEAMQQSGQNVGYAVELAHSAAGALDKIKQSINEVTEMTLQIASATEQQSYVCEDVSTNLTKISVLTQQTAEGAQQLSQVGSELDQTAGDLQVRLSSFKI